MAAESILLGWEDAGRRRPVRVRERDLTGRHWLVTGRTGSGKTYLLLGTILDLLLHHEGVQVVLIDGKGEAAEELLNRWLPVVAGDRPDLRPEAVTTVAPWGTYGVPMNVLAPIRGVGADLQAALNVRLFEKFLGESMGARMAPMLQEVMRAVSQTRGSLVQVLRAIEDEGYRLGLADQLRDQGLRRYLTTTLPQEPTSTLSALRARIRHLLSLDRLRSLLGAQDCLSGADLLSGRLTVVSLGNPPLGHAELSRWLGGWWMHVLTAAIFDRAQRATDIVVVIDEFDMVAPAAEDLARILQKARSYRAALHLATQSLEQVEDGRLVSTVLTNVSAWVAMSPRESELRHLGGALPPCRGLTPDPEVPDRLLTPAQEEALRLARLRSLGPRQALYVDRAHGESRLILETPSLPVAEVHRRAARLPESLRDAYWRGSAGALPEELPQARDVEVGARAPDAVVVELGTRARHPRRPALELP